MKHIKYIDVKTQAGEPRIAGIIGNHWVSISSGVGRTSADWQVHQRPGEWMRGETVTDDFGQIYKHFTNPKAYTSAQLRAIRTEQQHNRINHRAELRAWLRTAAEVVSLALMAAALALFLWAM